MLKAEDCPGLTKISRIRALEAQGQRRVSILVGNNGLFYPLELARGADGAMTGVAYPEMLTEVYRAMKAGDRDFADDLFEIYLPLVRYETQPGVALAWRKEILRRRGAIASARVRPPGPQLNADEHEDLTRMMARIESKLAVLKKGRSDMSFDTVIRGGTVVTATETRLADVGIVAGKVAAVASDLAAGAREIDARGQLVLPGGVDSHCHIEQVSSFGIMCADDFHSATVSAAFGGTTTVIPFCAQHRTDHIPEVLADYHRRAAEKAVIDYGFHLIVANPDEQTLATDLPAAIDTGVRSFKIFMTYDRMRLHDEQILDVLATARRHGALTMVHAENHGIIGWLAKRMVAQGNVAPRYHAVCHTRSSESEAIHRVIALAEVVDTPILIVHVSTVEGVQAIREARARGVKVYGETCPQYLFLTAEDIDRGLEGAMFCCSPPPRDAAAQQACWDGLKDGTLAVYSSDHAPYRFDATGKLPKGEKTTFKEMANGVPGLELRLPLLFTYGVGAGRITLNEFVQLTATRHAEIYGLAPAKGDNRAGQRRRHRHLGPRAPRDGRRRAAARQHRLHALRRPRAEGLAGDGAVARRGAGGRVAPRRDHGCARSWPLHRAHAHRCIGACRPPDPRDGAARRLEHAAGALIAPPHPAFEHGHPWQENCTSPRRNSAPSIWPTRARPWSPACASCCARRIRAACASWSSPSWR